MNYDVIVLGTGGLGSAALMHLADRGVRVLGLDRFPPGHDKGSSHGETRVIRRSYFEHPDYVPLLNFAYDLWHELGRISDTQLLHRSGLLYFGKPDGPVIRGILNSAQQHNLTVEQLALSDAESRFPQFHAPPDTTALFEPDGGFLLVEECVKAHIRHAINRGAYHQHSETVIRWKATNNHVRVETNKGQYKAAKLVITAGCYTNSLLNELKLPLKVLRKHQHWYAGHALQFSAAEGCPCYFFETGDGYFYGCPAISSRGLKVAEHSGGTEVHNPLSDSGQPERGDSQRIADFITTHLPEIGAGPTFHKACFYSMTPDEHFIVDRHPEHDSVVFAAGLSGHGFKFASALGRVLAELAVDQQPSCDVAFLNLSRDGLMPG